MRKNSVSLNKFKEAFFSLKTKKNVQDMTI